MCWQLHGRRSPPRALHAANETSGPSTSSKLESVVQASAELVLEATLKAEAERAAAAEAAEQQQAAEAAARCGGRTA